MSVTSAANFAGTYSKSWDVTATADGDTTGTISHGFGATPGLVWLVPLQSAQAYGKQWSLGTVNTSTITINGVSAASSGLAGTPQLRVIAMLPHSIIG